jgi:hypothetical protein
VPERSGSRNQALTGGVTTDESGDRIINRLIHQVRQDSANEQPGAWKFIPPRVSHFTANPEMAEKEHILTASKSLCDSLL